MPMPTFATEAEIPDAFRPEYTQAADGQWRSKAEIELELEKGKKQTLLDEKKDEERKRREAEQKAAELQATIDGHAGSVSAEEAQLAIAAAIDARKPIEAENAQLKSEVRKLKFSDRLRALAVSNGIMGDRLEDAMALILSRADLDDNEVLVFRDAKGAVTQHDAAQFFAAFRTEKPWLFAFTGGSGSGAPASTTTHARDAMSAPTKSDAAFLQQRHRIASAF